MFTDVAPQRMVTTREAMNQTFKEEMRRNKDIFIIGEEIGASGGPFGVTKDLLEKFGGHRVVDMPISEIGFTGLAIGAALMGLHPVVDFMSMAFSLQAADQIINTCAKLPFMFASGTECSILFRGPSGANFGYAAQHTQEFYALYGCVPGISVVAPFTPGEHRALLRHALRSSKPVIFLENEMLYGMEEEHLTEESMSLERARILAYGSDITVVGISYSLKMIMDASKESNHSVEVINLISIHPIDVETIVTSVRKTGCLIVVDFGSPYFGIASEISAKVYEKVFGELSARIRALCAKDSPVPYAEDLENDHYPQKETLIAMIGEVVMSKFSL